MLLGVDDVDDSAPQLLGDLVEGRGKGGGGGWRRVRCLGRVFR